ncbi:hypothetical protein [Haliangium ochraceum]|uniref:Uncharacterized protein n=1 Tax=Haliangium ochraceum (strain DSM 14365 / JCM 11303 / SMP-2) TaxID=502025 RepID=D0LXT1_HALO1|nr:hypothetical protein [Haliangium ochraceum]ACY14286.1 hypothetical protein Hoch_1737 [Haliangium ochraceum DSM 14365]
MPYRLLAARLQDRGSQPGGRIRPPVRSEETFFEFGPQLEVELADDVLLGASLIWRDDDLKDERFAMSLSRSFGLK